MKQILSYNDFMNELNSYNIQYDNIKENLIVSKYIDNKINNVHFEQFLYNDLNDFLSKNDIMLENIDISSLLSKGKDAIMNWFFGILKTIFEKGKSAIKNVQNILKTVINVIKKFTQKYPLLTKVMIILIIILILILLSSQTAMASTGTSPLSEVELQYMSTLIDATIGYLGDMMVNNETGTAQIQDLSNSLLKIKEQMLGNDVDMSQVSEQLKNTTKAAFNYINTFSDTEVSEYAKKGSEFLQKYSK